MCWSSVRWRTRRCRVDVRGMLAAAAGTGARRGNVSASIGSVAWRTTRCGEKSPHQPRRGVNRHARAYFTAAALGVKQAPAVSAAKRLDFPWELPDWRSRTASCRAAARCCCRFSRRLVGRSTGQWARRAGIQAALGGRDDRCQIARCAAMLRSGPSKSAIPTWAKTWCRPSQGAHAAASGMNTAAHPAQHETNCHGARFFAEGARKTFVLLKVSPQLHSQ